MRSAKFRLAQGTVTLFSNFTPQRGIGGGIVFCGGFFSNGAEEYVMGSVESQGFRDWCMKFEFVHGRIVLKIECRLNSTRNHHWKITSDSSPLEDHLSLFNSKVCMQSLFSL
ncbi:hypothetical protein GmHk_02G004968 [Glycine max]|nr:hypothetical protein GmHk_02G004968 [Glycine max]